MKKFELNVVNFDNEDVIATSTVDVTFYAVQHSGNPGETAHFHLIPVDGYDDYDDADSAQTLENNIALMDDVNNLDSVNCTRTGNRYQRSKGYVIPGIAAEDPVTLSLDKTTGTYTYNPAE